MRFQASRGAAGLSAALLLFAPGAAKAQGMTADAYARMMAPAPLDVSARASGAGVVIRWSTPPAPPSGKLAYDRAFARYRVYRLVGETERVIGETRETTFTDRAPPPGAVRYVVAAVQRSGQEGARSDQAAPGGR